MATRKQVKFLRAPDEPKTNDDLHDLGRQYVLSRNVRDEAAAEVAKAGGQIKDLMETLDETKAVFPDLSITYVESVSTVIDQDKLKKALGAEMWNKVTTRTLDKNKLDAFVKSGEIDPVLIAKASNEVPRTPTLRVTTK